LAIVLKNMNIAYVLLGNTVGGAEKRITNLYDYLSNNKNDYGFEFFLILSEENYLQLINIIPDLDHRNLIIRKIKSKSNKLATAILKSNILVNDKKKEKRYKAIRKIYNEALEWKRLINDAIYLNLIYKQYKIDIAHTITNGAFATTFLRLFKRKPIHILNYMDINHSAISPKIINMPKSYYFSLLNCDIVDFLGNSYYSSLLKIFPKLYLNNVAIAPNSFTTIDISHQNDKVKENIVVFASRLESNKNPLLFLDVCKIILKERSDIQFVLCGKGYLENTILQFIDSNNIKEKVDFRYCTDINQVLSKSKIFLSLQEKDNYPSQSIIEAMYLGNVVIGTNVGDTKTIINENHGYLVDFNAHQIAEIVELLIDNPLLFEEKSRKSEDFAKCNHNINNYIQYLFTLYKKFVF
jgi:glycosyltransferase involved in cell wall biosynthesis